jgi:hypothetical protein
VQVGDLVKSRLTRLDDVGVVLTIANSQKGYGQATVGWSTGQIQYFDLDLLKVINASR